MYNITYVYIYIYVHIYRCIYIYIYIYMHTYVDSMESVLRVLELKATEARGARQEGHGVDAY